MDTFGFKNCEPALIAPSPAAVPITELAVTGTPLRRISGSLRPRAVPLITPPRAENDCVAGSTEIN